MPLHVISWTSRRLGSSLLRRKYPLGGRVRGSIAVWGDSSGNVTLPPDNVTDAKRCGGIGVACMQCMLGCRSCQIGSVIQSEIGGRVCCPSICRPAHPCPSKFGLRFHHAAMIGERMYGVESKDRRVQKTRRIRWIEGSLPRGHRTPLEDAISTSGTSLDHTSRVSFSVSSQKTIIRLS